MALDGNATKIANLIDPEVMADYFDAKLIDAIKLSPLAVVNTELQGRPGDTLSIPVYAYIGDAADVAEGDDIDIAQLTASSNDYKIKKAGKGVQLTDEALLSAYGDPVDECGEQMVKAIGTKVDDDLLAVLYAITGTMLYHNVAVTNALTSAAIFQALVKFGEDFEGDKILFINAQQHADLLSDETWIKATDMGVERLTKGIIGMIAGCQVMVSNKITQTAGVWNNYIVKPGALGILLKRDTAFETDRDIVNKSTVITADKHYIAYLKNAEKAIRVTTNTSSIVTFVPNESETVIVVKNSAGEVVAATSGYEYLLDIGSYTYTATLATFTTQTDVALAIASTDVVNDKSVTVTMVSSG